VKGIMLAYNGKRYGCAIFHSAIGEKTIWEKRRLLFTYVHEIGHCFNLLHPWDRYQKNSPSRETLHSSLSWMNLPEKYYSAKEYYGEDRFWKKFQFEFDDSELMHLRHGFRNNVIFGGRNFNEYSNSK
jgi:hypothetical protein